MKDDSRPGAPEAPPAFGRLPMQERSKARREKITAAVIQLLGEAGEARLTHRDVARTAQVSLAATTYYYGSKLDLLTDASQAILQGYVRTFRAFVERHRGTSRKHPSFREAIRRIIVNGLVRDRGDTIAWCEIMAACGRNPGTRALSREWYRNLHALWHELAGLLGGPEDRLEIVCTLDQVVGLLFLGVPLRFDQAVFERALAGRFIDAVPPAEPPRFTGDAQGGETRQRIIDAAIRLMAREGAGAVTGRGVATEAGVAPAAPGYYFKPVTLLLEAARNQLYERERARFGELMTVASRNAPELEDLVDLLTGILIREVTQFGELNLASLSIDVEAAREPALQPVVAQRRKSEERAWDEVLRLSGTGRRPCDALLAMCLFYGIKVRLLATGCDISDLATVRKELKAALVGFRGQGNWI